MAGQIPLIWKNGRMQQMPASDHVDWSRLPVQGDFRDSTAQKLLHPGSFGLGSVGSGPTHLDVDDPTEPSSFFRTTGATAGTLPAGISGFGMGYQFRYNQQNQVQYYLPINNDSIWHRRFKTDTWGPWRQLMERGHILGTVSQSGGVPTGDILETGTNSNGRYVRLADGTQFCMAEVYEESLAINTPSGVLFRSAPLSYTFPASFTGEPEFSCASFLGSDSTTIRNNLITMLAERGGSGTWPGWNNIIFWSAVSATANAGEFTSAKLFAVGRWY